MAALPASVAALALIAAGCSGDDDSDDISVFSVKAGQCFTAPASVKVQLDTLNRTKCSNAHTLEAYAVLGYQVPSANRSGLTTAPTSTSSYPGEDVLTTFAQGSCAQKFGQYVGVSYLDSSLFFTFLLPSARSWEQAQDRNVLCFVTTTGGKLKSSVKDSKR
jgi:hypothetical protein